VHVLQTWDFLSPPHRICKDVQFLRTGVHLNQVSQTRSVRPLNLYDTLSDLIYMVFSLTSFQVQHMFLFSVKEFFSSKFLIVAVLHDPKVCHLWMVTYNTHQNTKQWIKIVILIILMKSVFANKQSNNIYSLAQLYSSK
jgi:hypothetical protein